MKIISQTTDECKNDELQKFFVRGHNLVNMVNGATAIIFKDVKFGATIISALES